MSMEQNISHAFESAASFPEYDPTAHASPPYDPSTNPPYAPPGTYDSSAAPFVPYRGSTPPDIEMMSVKSDSSEILRAIQEDIHSHREQASKDMTDLKEQSSKDMRGLKEQMRGLKEQSSKDMRALKQEFVSLKDEMITFSKAMIKSAESNTTLFRNMADRLVRIESDGTQIRKETAELRAEVRKTQRQGELIEQHCADRTKAILEGVAIAVASAVAHAIGKNKRGNAGVLQAEGGGEGGEGENAEGENTEDENAESENVDGEGEEDEENEE